MQQMHNPWVLLVFTVHVVDLKYNKKTSFLQVPKEHIDNSAEIFKSTYKRHNIFIYNNE